MNLIKTLSLIAAIAAFNVAYAADAAPACACPAKDGKACECTKDGKDCTCTPKAGKGMKARKGQCGPKEGCPADGKGCEQQAPKAE